MQQAYVGTCVAQAEKLIQHILMNGQKVFFMQRKGIDRCVILQRFSWEISVEGKHIAACRCVSGIIGY